MKKIAAIFLALLFIIPAYAHSGRTDSQGGHYNRSTGEYHFHHGYPAHQHENGVCPYDFDDKTGESSGASGGGSSSKKPTIVKGTSNSDSAKNDTSSSSSLPISIILILCAIGFYGLLCLWGVVSSAIYNRKHKKQWNAKQKELLDLYGGKTRFQIALECGMPYGVEIGTDGLPKEINSDTWGKSLTFYVSSSGRAYHISPTCTKSANIPTNAVQLGLRQPCRKCLPKAPDVQWYWRYKSVMQQLNQYQIIILDTVSDKKQSTFPTKH